MEKEFNFTPLQCDGKKILQLIEDSKYLKLDVYFKVDDVIHHVCFNINEDKTESDYEYYIDNQKFKSYIEFISNMNFAGKELKDIDSVEVLEVNNDGPHYHKTFLNDNLYVERENIIVSFEEKNIENKESKFIRTFNKPAHIWIIIENLIYITIIVISGVYGMTSLKKDGANIFNIGLLILIVFLLFFCFKDYFKYRIDIYNDKIIVPNTKIKDFSVSYKTVREIKYNEISKLVYVSNPKTGKMGRELVLITKDGAERVLSLNVLNKNQYVDLAIKLVEQLNEFYK